MDIDRQTDTETLLEKGLRHTDYKVGWVCILEVELAAALSMLDREYERLPKASPTTPSYTAVQFALLVGISGGVPFPLRTNAGDIRLGDVIVGRSNDHSSAVVQYDSSERLSPGSIAPPPPELLAAAEIATQRAVQCDTIKANYARINTSHPRLSGLGYPGHANDKLYQPRNPEMILQRPQDPRDQDAHPVIHCGEIASGDQVMKNAFVRDLMAQEHGIVCFKMEAAGVMAKLPCLVIRGVSDYCDSHKNDMWQGYAATVAAGFASRWKPSPMGQPSASL
ncbi:nucleoside phosphorylase domain-containing protein [Aspergillus insuetus]